MNNGPIGGHHTSHTPKRAYDDDANRKREYAAVLLWGIPKGCPLWHTHFATQSVMCYTLCQRCRANAVAVMKDTALKANGDLWQRDAKSRPFSLTPRAYMNYILRPPRYGKLRAAVFFIEQFYSCIEKHHHHSLSTDSSKSAKIPNFLFLSKLTTPCF